MSRPGERLSGGALNAALANELGELIANFTGRGATRSRALLHHVTPVWFVLDGEQFVFTAAADSVKGCNLRRDSRIARFVEDQTPPYAFVHVRGRVTLHENLDELRRFANGIAVAGELLVRATPQRVIAEDDVVGY